MKLHLAAGGTSNRFTAYGGGYLTVNGERHERALVVSPAALHDGLRATRFEQFDADDVKFLVSLKPEIVLLGSGARQQFPGMTVLRAFAEARIGLETMDSAAACRTYNILADEGRNVLAVVFTP